MLIKPSMRGPDSEPYPLVGPAFLYTKLNFLKNIPVHSSGEMHELVFTAAVSGDSGIFFSI